MSKTMYPFWKLLDMMQNAPDKNNICAVLTIAQEQWKKGSLTMHQFYGLLRHAALKVSSIE